MSSSLKPTKFCVFLLLLSVIIICEAKKQVIQSQLGDGVVSGKRIKRQAAGLLEIQSANNNHWVSTNITITAVIGDRISTVTGVSLSIKCPFRGNPLPRVIWYYKGQVVDGNSVENIEVINSKVDSTLLIKQFNKKHAGKYQCMVYNIYGRVTVTTSIRNITPFQPTIISKRSEQKFSALKDAVTIDIGTNITVYDKTDVSINCPIYANTTDYIIKWTSTAHSQKHVTKTAVPTLTLNNIDVGDSGIYACVVNDGDLKGDKQNSKIDVIRKISPSIKIKNDTVQYTKGISTAIVQVGNKVIIKAGFDLKIACPYVAVPKAKTYWRRNGMTLALPTDKVYVEEYRNQLVIKGIKEEHADTYTCVVENELDRKMASALVQVLPRNSIAPRISSGSASRTTRVTDVKIINPIRIGETVRIIEDASLKLVCRASGLPSPKLLWELNRKEISNDDSIILSGNMLLILNFQKKHSGDYKCRAKNMLGEARAWSDVRMIEPTAPSILSGTSYLKIAGPSTQVNINIGDRLKTTGGRDIQINCPTEGFPVAHLRWKINDEMIQNQVKIKKNDVQKTLTIKNTDEWDTGLYSCFATNGAGVAVSSSYIKILPQGSPIITSIGKQKSSLDTTQLVDIEIGTNLTTVTDKTLRIFCPSEGGENPSYDWTINGEQLRYDTRINLSNGYELIIHDLQFYDEGIYACRVYSQHGFDKMVSEVKIVAGQSTDGGNNGLVSDNEMVKVTVGDNVDVISHSSVEISCPTRGSVRPHLSWLKDGKPIVPGAHFLPRGERLLLNSLTKDSAGQYTCVMKTNAGTRSVSTNINVLDYQRVSIQSGSGLIKAFNPSVQVKATVGTAILTLPDMTVKITCPHTAVPKAKISWLFDGEIVDHGQGYTQEKTTDSIVIPKISEDLAGDYTCQAVQGQQVVEATSRIKLLSMQKPTIKRSSRVLITQLDVFDTVFMNIGDRLTSNIGKHVQIDCKGIGIPAPNVIWKINGKPAATIPGVTVKTNGSIKIPSVGMNHNGRFECFWINSVGIDSFESQITVVGTYIPLGYKAEHKDIKVLKLTSKTTSVSIGANVTILSKNSILMKCPVSIYGPIDTIWLKDGKTLLGTRHHHDGSVFLSELNAKDSGHYVCFSNDNTNFRFGDINMTILVPTEEFLDRTKETKDTEFLDKDTKVYKVNIGGRIKILRGNKMEIKCPVKSPSTKVDWLLNNEYFSSGNGVVINKHVLLLDGALSSGEYNFTCRVSGPLGSVDVTSPVHITAPTKLRIITNTEASSNIPTFEYAMGDDDISVVAGKSVNLKCPVSSIPPPIITWRKDGVDVKSVGGVYLKQNGFTLSIPAVDEKSAGIYICIASNGEDSITLTSNLKIFVPKKPQIIHKNENEVKSGILRGPVDKEVENVTLLTVTDEEVVIEIGKDYKVLSGQNLKLLCLTKGEPKPEVKWKKDSITLPNVGETLKINAKDSTSSGLYSCTATNVFGRVTQDSLIDVFAPSKPVIQRDPMKSNKTEILSYMDGKTKVDVYIGDDLKTISGTIIYVRCPAIGIPRPSISYYHNGNMLEMDNSTFIDSLGSLVLSPATLENNSQGVYTCHAENEAGFQEMNSTLILYNPTKPEFLPPVKKPLFSFDNNTKEKRLSLTIGENVVAYQNTYVSIICPVVGFPFPVVIWEKDGQVLSDGTVAMLKDNTTTLIYQVMVESVFTCTATNLAGTEQKQSTIYVTDPLPAKILTTDFEVVTATSMNTNITVGQNANVLAGSTLKITCPSVGEPKPIVRWSHDNNNENDWLESHPNVQFAPNGFEIIFLKITKDFIGQYICTASNDFGRDMKISYINVNDISPPRISSMHKIYHVQPDLQEVTTVVGGELYIHKGARAIVECPVTGIPPPQVKWFKDGIPLREDFDYDKASHVLTIDNISLKDEGVYTCTATNYINTASKDTKIRVGFRPSIAAVPKFLSPLISLKEYGFKIPIGVQEAFALLASTVQFRCFSHSYPKANITWYYNNFPIDRDNIEKYDTSFTRFLQVKQLKATDEGVYSCHAQNVFGLAKQETSLKIMEPPEILSNSENMTITEHSDTPVTLTVGASLILPRGMSIMITCPLNGRPKPAVQWSKRNTNFVVDKRMSVTTDKNFRIDGVQLSDSGDYVCSASNKVGSVTSTTHLLVAEKPKAAIIPNYRSSKFGKSSAVANGPGKLVVPDGTPIRLFCHVTGSPLAKLTWLKDHDIIRRSTKHRTNKWELEIQNATKEDEGVYVCMAVNVMGATTAMIQVTLGVPPKIHGSKLSLTEREEFVQIGIGSSINVKAGTTLKIICNATGVPHPTIKWRKSGILIPVPVRLQSGDNDVLTLRDVTKKMTGKYSCIASNVIGSQDASSTVLVLEPAEILPMKNLREKRKFVVGRENEVHAIEGEAVRISCYSTGWPRPHVSLLRSTKPLSENMLQHIVSRDELNQVSAYLKSMKHDKNISPSRRRYILKNRFIRRNGVRINSVVAEIFFASLKLKHIGKYTCKTRNNAGLETKSINLFVYPRPVKPYEGVWKVSQYGTCSTPCVKSNYGIQSRTVSCITFNGKTLNNRKCDGALRPNSTKLCQTTDCITEWRTGLWSKCSRSCGNEGKQQRISFCVFVKTKLRTKSEYCMDENRPPSSRACNIYPCNKEKCVDQFQYCTLMKHNGFCRMETYKTLCCYSCVKKLQEYF